MFTKAQQKLAKSLKLKKGRDQHGLCLVEGKKVIETAGSAVQFTFTHEDTSIFSSIVTTKSPQGIAGVAKIPTWTHEDIISKDTVVVLDAVQDPGNVGAIFRLCLAFNASLLLVESADTESPKVVRSSTGSIFQVPYVKVSRESINEVLQKIDREIFRLEKVEHAKSVHEVRTQKPAIIIAGSEGSGISIPVKGQSVVIDHSKDIESLNVGNAVAITLFVRRAF